MLINYTDVLEETPFILKVVLKETEKLFLFSSTSFNFWKMKSIKSISSKPSKKN